MEEKIKEILEEVLEVEVTEDTSDQNCDEWESFSQVSIAMLLEEELDIKVATQDILQLNSYKNVLDYVKTHNK